ncbi:aspartate 1-decarboxylase [bacterium]|nr:aspartate 1-decarboxylase [bacterium]
MLREMLKSKIHKAVITGKKIDYNGSIGVDKKLLDESGIFPGEKVQVLNFNNGQRLETYTIEEEENSGKIILYGPAGRCGEIGDKICILAYALVTEDDIEKIKPRKIVLRENNKIL